MDKQKEIKKECTYEHPYSEKEGDKWIHLYAQLIYSGVEYDYYECPVHGLSFKETVPG